MRLTLIILVLAAAPAIACLPVSGDRILARDIASAVPALSALPGNTILGYAPVPGSVRIFTVLELTSIVRTHRLPQVPITTEVCFTVPLAAHLDQAGVVAAMRQVLPDKAALAIVELPTFPVPVGDVVFAIEALEPPQPIDPELQTWRGYVRYGGNRRMAVWARVRITVERSVVVAKRSLLQGESITGESVAVESQRGPLRPERIVETAAEAIGMKLLRPVKQGTLLTLAMLERPPLVRRGDPIKVEVVNGGARLMLSAIAETNGRKGEQIQLRNPVTGRTFQARIESAEKAVVASSSYGLLK